MSGAPSCPQCGRAVKPEHRLCVKCGAKLQKPRLADVGPGGVPGAVSSRLRTAATILAVLAIAGVVAVIWLLAKESSPRSAEKRSTPRSGLAAAPGSPEAAAAEPALLVPGELGSRDVSPLSAPPGRPPGRSAGKAPSPSPSTGPGHGAGDQPPGARPGTPPKRPGVLTRIGRCVDAKRREGGDTCRGVRRWLGQTTGALCAWGAVVKIYYKCIKAEALGSGACLAGCSVAGTVCIAGCRKAERPKNQSYPGCLASCWRKRMDACLGACIAP